MENYPHNLLQAAFGSSENVDLEKLDENLRNLLDNREIEFLRLRFEQGLTLEAIARKNGLTRERVRQKIKSTIYKMNINYSLFKQESDEAPDFKEPEENVLIETLRLSNRPLLALKKANIRYVHELVKLTNAQLLDLKGLWGNSLKEIDRKLAESGYVRNCNNLREDVFKLLETYGLTIPQLIAYVKGLQK